MTAIKTTIGGRDQASNTSVAPSATLPYSDVQAALLAMRQEIDDILAVLPAPGTVVDNTVPRFNGTSGLIEDTGLTISDTDFLGGAAGVGIGGATADATNRLSANTPAVLFNRETDDIQVKLNKEAAGDTASFLFQTGFSGRAEIGLVGNDDFVFKVSPDGAVFTTGISIDKDDGSVTIPTSLSVTGGGAFGSDVTVPDEAYNAASWNASLEVPTKNAVRDYLELLTGTTLPAAYQPLDATLTAWAAYNTNGILTQTATDTFAGRTITGTADEITVTNGSGVAGNPTISIPVAVTLTGKTLTGGTFSGPTWSGTVTFASTSWTASGATVTITSAGATVLALTGAGNCGIELGRIDGNASTPFVDFHSGATAVDYDARLIASGGTGASGGGSLRLTAADLSPTTNDIAALGTTSLGWSDVHLATGAVVNYANGNLTVTHSSGLLTYSGGVTISGTTTLGTVAGTIDAGGATSLEIPNGAAPTVNADGEIAVDTSVADFSHGIVKYFSGEELAVIAVPVAQLTTPTDGDVVAYNATNDEFELVPQSGSGGATLATEQVTTSGTEFDFTGIGASATRIMVIFNEVSLSGTDDFLIQIGDSGGVETTGYISTSDLAAARVSSTSGFIVQQSQAARILSGVMTLVRVNALTWISSHACKVSATACCYGGGSKSVSATLDRVRITRSATNTFDGGSVNVLWE